MDWNRRLLDVFKFLAGMVVLYTTALTLHFYSVLPKTDIESRVELNVLVRLVPTLRRDC